MQFLNNKIIFIAIATLIFLIFAFMITRLINIESRSTIKSTISESKGLWIGISIGIIVTILFNMI